MALKYARHHIFSDVRQAVPKIAVLITDGESWYREKTIHQAKLLKRHNVTIFTVAISKQVGRVIAGSVDCSWSKSERRLHRLGSRSTTAVGLSE